MQHSTIPHTSLGLVCPVTARRGWLYVAMLSKPPFVLHVRAACRAGQCKVQEGQSSRGGHGLLRRCVRHKPDGSQSRYSKTLMFLQRVVRLLACTHARANAHPGALQRPANRWYTAGPPWQRSRPPTRRAGTRSRGAPRGWPPV